MSFSLNHVAMAESSHKAKLTTIWLHPEETTKTVDDELDDMFCAPCLTKMKQGTCGSFMEAYLRCTYKAYKTNTTFEPCVLPYHKMVECFTSSPKEYARELANMTKGKSAEASSASPAL